MAYDSISYDYISILKIIRCRQLNFIYYALVVCFSKKMGEEERKVYFSVKEDFDNFWSNSMTDINILLLKYFKVID